MERTHGLRLWGAAGAVVAAVFATWLLLFPGLVGPYFAWPAEPRLGQIFLAAGWVFRIGFFLSAWRERAWHRLRWLFWGNVAFTGTLLLATFLHADRFTWSFPLAWLWLVLYVAEPVAMIYQTARLPEAWHAAPLRTAPLQPALKWVLVVEAAVLGTVGALLVLNPAFMDPLWPWPLRPLGARIMAAWFLGWAVWAGTLALGRDWDEVRIGVELNILWGVALLASLVVFLPLYDFARPGTPVYVATIAIFTLVLGVLAWRQARVRTTVSA